MSLRVLGDNILFMVGMSSSVAVHALVIVIVADRSDANRVEVPVG